MTKFGPELVCERGVPAKVIQMKSETQHTYVNTTTGRSVTLNLKTGEITFHESNQSGVTGFRED